MLKTNTDCSDTETLSVEIKPCYCYTKTIGYWSNHGNQLGMALDKFGSFWLWGREYTDVGVTRNDQPNSCTKAQSTPDPLWVLCAAGASECR